MKYTFFTLLFTFCSIALFAQSESLYEIGVETQVYPTGVIPGVRFAFLPDSKNEYTLRVGYQFIDHRDLGKHLDETGSGFGGSIGYRRFLKDNSKGFAIGARVDVWKNTIDWEDEVIGIPVTGTTDIIVLQPTAIAEYVFSFGDFKVIPSVAFGIEWNVKTEGEPTGEGAILLLGLTLGQRI